MNPMNPLAALKERLMIKPNVEERERVAVVIKGVKRHYKPQDSSKKAPKKAKELEEGELSEEEGSLYKMELQEEAATKKTAPLIVDETERGFDRNALLQKLAESKKLKVTIQPVLKISEERSEFISGSIFLPNTSITFIFTDFGSLKVNFKYDSELLGFGNNDKFTLLVN